MKYKVLVIALLLKNNVVAKFGEEVTADQLSDSAQNLIKGGYIAEVAPSSADLQKAADEAKAKELADAQAALDAANIALSTAKANADAAPAELKDAANVAITNAQAAADAAQAAVDALTAPVKDTTKKK